MGINPFLIRIIWNFLTDRTGYVFYNGVSGSIFKIPLGCVQGSVLGPKLFNIYMNDIESNLPQEVFTTSYADDSYVGVSFSVMSSHFEYLEKNEWYAIEVKLS